MLAPQVFNVGLEGRAERAKVIEAGAAAIDIERGRVEELSLQEIFAEVARVLELEVDGFFLLLGSYKSKIKSVNVTE